MNERLTDVQGLSGLLRAVAGRIENNVDGLNTQLLLQSAERLDLLEMVADNAKAIIERVPNSKNRSERKSVKVNIILLKDLADALETANFRISRANV